MDADGRGLQLKNLRSSACIRVLINSRCTVKIILSRKGFDASAGGVASPLLPDGTLLSLPIPDVNGPVTYGELTWGQHAVGDLVTALTRGRLAHHTHVHLDPDLYGPICPRRPGWRPLFGQDGAAQSHLQNQGVGVGDLFLFFGWFRAVEAQGGSYRFVKSAPDQHLIYGWLQVGTILTNAQLTTATPPWAVTQPHCGGGRGSRNTVYIASPTLTLAGRTTAIPGAGYLGDYRETYRLTAPNRLRTQWRLPRWFYPTAGRPPLSYHTALTRWACTDDYAYLHSATRGQEFVLDTVYYPEALSWIVDLLPQTSD